MIVDLIYRTAFLWWRLCRDAFEPHAVCSLTLPLSVRPFWPVISTVALRSALQRLLLLTSRPFLPPCEFEDELRDRRVGHRVEGGPQAALLGGVDLAGELDVDLPVQVGDQVGQFRARGPQVDGARQRLVEQRRRRRRRAVDRVRRARVRRELDPGADGADVGVVEQLVLRHRDRRRGGCSLRPASSCSSVLQRRVAAPLGRARQLQARASGRRPGWRSWRPGSGSTELDARAFARRTMRRVDAERVAVGRVEGEARPIEVDQHRAEPQRHAFEDLRDRVGDRRHLGGDRVDEDRRADDDVAEVVGPRDRRDDDDEAQRSALVRAREVDLARACRAGGCRRRRRWWRCRSGSRPGRRATPARLCRSSPALRSRSIADSGQ